STPEGAAVFNGSRNALHQHLTRSSRMTLASDAVAMPVALGLDDRAKANNVFDHWAQALDAFEASANVSAFSSKFDAFLAGTYTLTADEQAGYDLFRGKATAIRAIWMAEGPRSRATKLILARPQAGRLC